MNNAGITDTVLHALAGAVSGLSSGAFAVVMYLVNIPLVPWATYNSQLQPRIDAATATLDCAALRAFLTAAKTTSTAHEKATGVPQRRPGVLYPGQPARGGLPAGMRPTRRQASCSRRSQTCPTRPWGQGQRKTDQRRLPERARPSGRGGAPAPGQAPALLPP